MANVSKSEAFLLLTLNMAILVSKISAIIGFMINTLLDVNN